MFFFLKKGDVLFNSWNDIFNGDGALLLGQSRIFSFSGKLIQKDSSWYVQRTS